jgi:hypothetical protein
LDKADPLYLQTAYSLESPYLIVATAGDPAEAIVGLNNNRAKEFKAQVKMTLPDGWTSTQMEASVSAKPGEKTTVKMPFVVGAAEHLGVKDVIFTVTEEGKPIKTIPLRVVVQRPYAFEVSSLAGAPGPAQVQATITNKSAMTRSATLRLKLPQGWSTANATLEVKEVQPGETRTVKVDLTWKAEWKENESASLVLEEKSVVMAEAPIIPNQYRLLQATKFVIDGDLKDWSDKLQFPSWMTGSTAGPSKAKVWLAWSPEGLYGAAEVEDSKVVADDPKSFWGCDVLELFFSTEEAKRKDWYQKGDHQFWLVPLIKENRVYTGRWKVKDEIKETQYDLPGVKSVARKTPQGYVMEFFLPPSVFDSYGLKAGGQVGLNFNLTVRGMNFDREVYWPKNKATGVNLQPSQWGTVKLGE